MASRSISIMRYACLLVSLFLARKAVKLHQPWKKLWHDDNVWRFTEQPDFMFLTVLSTVHESFKELEIAGCIHCLLYDEYLTVVNVRDVHRKYYHHFTSESTRHWHQTRFFSKTTPLPRLILFLFKLIWNPLMRCPFLLSLYIFNV